MDRRRPPLPAARCRGLRALPKAGIPCNRVPDASAMRIAYVITRAYGIAGRWADAIVCVCEYERQLALSKRVGSPEKLHVIHNGVSDVSESLRARPEDAPVRICSLARLESPKDHATLLRALALIGGDD